MLKVKYTSETKCVPTYATKGSAGFDVFAKEDVILKPGEWAKISTGWRFQLPEGYALLSCSRSGNAVKKGLVSHIGPGVIDSDYRGECFACVRNVSNEEQIIKAGERIIQFVIIKVEQAEFELVDSLENTERGEGGFGSTGR